MSNLLKKSEQNRIAVQYLKDKDFCASAVHCAYYSCVQKIKYILIEYFPKENEACIKSIKGGKGSLHMTLYINEFSKLITPLVRDREKIRDLKFNLKQLKMFRMESDYEDVEISDTKLEKVQLYVNNVHQLIWKYLSL